jgi:YidC/Oxa1 family membrane protein insertase
MLGSGFITTNIMLPILDFFYGIVPSYGLAIIALTLVTRLAVYPLSAGQIRNMRKMRITQPLMKERQEAIQKKYKDNPQKQQEEMGKLMQEFGNPLAGCLPLLVQMPILLALFGTLKGSPFADSNYLVNIQILPREQIERVQPQNYSTKPQNIYFSDGIHYPITAVIPEGNKIAVGQTTQIKLQTEAGKPLQEIDADHPDYQIQPKLTVTKGMEKIRVNESGQIEALEPGDATIQVTVPGIAANKGFLFIKALGRVGATAEDGSINWDILAMIVTFGLSIYVNQQMSGAGGDSAAAQQQKAVNQITPVLFSGMFLFFPLPAGVLMYILVANLFQMTQTFILMKEPLPENLQKLVEQQEKTEQNRKELPFEHKSSKKKEKTSG